MSTPVSEGSKIRISVTKIPLIDRILLLGAPGIGKTEIIKQKSMEEARRLGKVFADLREVSEETISDILNHPEKYYIYLRIVAPHIFPEDLGIPKMINHSSNKDYVEYVPPKALKILSLPEIHGTLFIDEITNVQRDDQISMYYSLILEKEAGFQLKLSRNVKIVLAGNTPEWSTIVRELPAPLINRMKIFEVLPPTVDEWLDYMMRTYNDDWEKSCGLYLKMFPTELLMPPKQAFEAFPTPRSWTLTCRDIYELKKSGVDEETMEAVAVGGLGQEVGLKFSRIFKINIDLAAVLKEIASKPEVFDDLELDAKIIVLSSVASQTVEGVNRLRGFFEHLLANHRELLTVVIMLMNKDVKKRLLSHDWFKNLIEKLAKDISRFT